MAVAQNAGVPLTSDSTPAKKLKRSYGQRSGLDRHLAAQRTALRIARSEQLQRGEQIHLRYEQGKPWFWHVGISYTETPKKEDVNYFPTGVINLKKTTQGDELLKRKRENQQAKELIENNNKVLI